MPPKGWRKSHAAMQDPLGSASGTPGPSNVLLPEQLSFMHIPKPFKNPYYTKNQTRRTQTLKTLLAREKERDKAIRAERKEQKLQPLAEKQTKDGDGDEMEIDEGAIEQRKKGGAAKQGKELDKDDSDWECDPEDLPSHFSTEAPPSFLPLRKYCDITGLEAPYRDPKTKLRYHDLGVYNYLQNLNPATIQAHLSVRGHGPVILRI